MDRPRAVAELRAEVARFARRHLAGAQRWCVALSGGPDSLALTAVAADLLPTTALIVDHGLQPDSAAVTDAARGEALRLGCADARVLRVERRHLGRAGSRRAHGPVRRAARRARATLRCYSATPSTTRRRRCCSGWVAARVRVPSRVCGCATRPGTARCWGCGAPRPSPHAPTSACDRGTIRTTATPGTPAAGCAPRCCRCSRTSSPEEWPRRSPAPPRRCRRTTTPSTAQADLALADVTCGAGLDAARLAELPAAIRRRVIRSWLLAGGARGLSDPQIQGVDALVSAWRGQGPVAVPSNSVRQRLIAARRDGMLTLHREPV